MAIKIANPLAIQAQPDQIEFRHECKDLIIINPRTGNPMKVGHEEMSVAN